MALDLLIKDTSVITDGLEMHQVDIGVAGGRVAFIGRPGDVSAAETIDGRGRFVLPGLVDIGSSLLAESPRWLASPQSFGEMTAHALRGGVTTVIAPATFEGNKPIAEELAAKRAKDQAAARVDFGYHYFLSDWTEERRRHLRTAANAGVPSVWIAIAKGEETTACGAALIHAAMRDLPDNTLAIARLGDPILEGYFRAEMRAQGHVAPHMFGAAFPDQVEAATLRLYGALARGSRSRLVVMGLSSLAALEEFERQRAQGAPLVGAVKLSHLVLTNDMHEEGSPQGLPFPWPPLRARQDQQALWAALDGGLLSVVTSAHHPVALDDVRRGQTDCSQAACGSSGIAHLLQLLHSEGVAKWRLSAEALSQCACADPAKLAGLYPRKGSLQIGSDADLVILNPSAQTALSDTGGDVFFDPYAGMETSTALEAVYLRGTRVLGDGAGQNPGQFLERRVSLA